MQISDNNQLDWKRSDMFADGVIGSRGFWMYASPSTTACGAR